MIDSIIWGSIKGRTLFGSCKKPCTNSTLFNSILNWPIRAGANQNILQKLWRRVERSEFKGSSSGSGLASTNQVHADVLDCASASNWNCKLQIAPVNLKPTPITYHCLNFMKRCPLQMIFTNDISISAALNQIVKHKSKFWYKLVDLGFWFQVNLECLVQQHGKLCYVSAHQKKYLQISSHGVGSQDICSPRSSHVGHGGLRASVHWSVGGPGRNSCQLLLACGCRSCLGGSGYRGSWANCGGHQLAWLLARVHASCGWSS